MGMIRGFVCACQRFIYYEKDLRVYLPMRGASQPLTHLQDIDAHVGRRFVWACQRCIYYEKDLRVYLPMRGATHSPARQ